MLYVLMFMSLVAHSQQHLFRERHSCEGSSQGKNLGNVNSFSECEAKAISEHNAGGDCYFFMWSEKYSYAWGCRCCKRAGIYGFHSLWNIYQIFPCATLYEHSNFNGAQLDISPDETYDLIRSNKNWDNRVSSFKVYEDCVLALYCGGTSGWFQGYSSFMYYMGTWEGPYQTNLVNSWNDCVSGIMCTCGRKRRLEEPHELPAPTLGQLPEAEEYNTTDASGSTVTKWEAKWVDRNGEEKEVDENKIDLMERIAGELAQEARATGTRSEEGQP